jgi:ribonucleoside-diphosphate reductase alpha chain
VNFPASATKEDIAEVYMLAHSTGCKGVTVYRDGCRESQVMNRGAALAEEREGHRERSAVPAEASNGDSPMTVAPQLRVRPRPDIVTGATRKVLTGCGNLYVTINKDEDNAPFEVFSQMGKAGGCAASQTEAISRLISLALRSGVPMKEITRQLSGINCHRPAWSGGEQIHSCADAIAKSLVKDMDPEDLGRDHPIETQSIRGACPDCGGALVHEMGCTVCRDCAYSECA